MKRNKTSLKLFLTTFYINLSTFEFKVFEDLFLKKKSNSKYQCFFQAAGCEQDLCWCCECHWWLFSRMLTNVKLRVQVYTLMFVGVIWSLWSGVICNGSSKTVVDTIFCLPLLMISVPFSEFLSEPFSFTTSFEPDFFRFLM